MITPMLQTPVKKGGSGCLRAGHANLLPAGSTKISADGNLASKLARLAGEADSIRYYNNDKMIYNDDKTYAMMIMTKVYLNMKTPASTQIHKDANVGHPQPDRNYLWTFLPIFLPL